MGFDKGSGLAIIGISVDGRQSRAIATYYSAHNVKLVDLDGSGIVVFTIESSGHIKTTTFVPISATSVSQPELAISSDAVFVGATTARHGRRSAFAAMLTRDAINNEFKISWEQEFQIASSSTQISSLAVWQNHFLLVAGDTAMEQAATGSIVKAGDCFMALIDVKGHVVTHDVFGSTSNSDHVVKLVPFLDNQAIALIYLENLPLTHDVKTEPLCSIFRKIPVKNL